MSPIPSAPSRSALPNAIRELNQDPEYHPISGDLHHYTSLDALLSICNSKKLRATSVHYLNDANESELGLALISEAAKAIAPEGRIETDFWTYFDAWLSSRLFQDASVYVLCFSEVGNTLSQWRGYTQHGRGVCIAIDAGLLVKRMQAMGWTFQNCRYQRMSQESWARAIVRRMVNEAKKAVGAAEPNDQIFNSVINKALSDMLQVAATIKDHSFSEEKEIRFISPMIHTADSRVSFRVGRSALIPFVEFDLVGAPDDIMRFEQIVVGPSPTQELTVAALRGLIEQKGIEVNSGVTWSSIPYREL
jgi:hypothetical protein